MARKLLIAAPLLVGAILIAFLTWRHADISQQRDKGLKLAAERAFDEAEPMLKAAVAHDPFDFDVLRALAKLYLARDRKADADATLTQWLAQKPDDSEALLLRIDLRRDLGQFERAVMDGDRLVQLDPNNLTWRRKRMAILFAASRFSEAEKECQVCLSMKPTDHALARSLAEIQKTQGKLTDAAKTLETILAEAPNDTATLAARATLHLSQDEPAKAIPMLRKVVLSDPNRQRSGRYYLALALNRVGETAEADQIMEEVRRMQHAEALREDSSGQPNNLPLQMRNARAQFENNDLPRTVKVLQHVLGVDAKYAPAHTLMAEVLEKQGRFDLAAEHRRRAKESP